VRPDPLSGLGMEAIEINLELVLVDAPYSAAPKFYGGQLVTSHQGVDLGDADVEISGDLFERHESGHQTGSFAGVLSAAHGRSLAKLASVWTNVPLFTSRNLEETRSPWTSR